MTIIGIPSVGNVSYMVVGQGTRYDCFVCKLFHWPWYIHHWERCHAGLLSARNSQLTPFGFPADTIRRAVQRLQPLSAGWGEYTESEKKSCPRAVCHFYSFVQLMVGSQANFFASSYCPYAFCFLASSCQLVQMPGKPAALLSHICSFSLPNLEKVNCIRQCVGNLGLP